MFLFQTKGRGEIVIVPSNLPEKNCTCFLVMTRTRLIHEDLHENFIASFKQKNRYLKSYNKGAEN